MLEEISNFAYNLSHSYKADTALRTIGEVSEEIGIETHVLRFWESKFKEIQPQKRRGRRYYSQSDIKVLMQIKSLLYGQGLTIKGVQKFFSKGGNSKHFDNENKSANNTILQLVKEPPTNKALTSNDKDLLIIYNNLINFRNKIATL